MSLTFLTFLRFFRYIVNFQVLCGGSRYWSSSIIFRHFVSYGKRQPFFTITTLKNENVLFWPYSLHPSARSTTHSAVITEFGLELQYDNCASRISTNRDNFSLWYKATEYDICNYKNMLDTELSKVHVPANLTTYSEIDCSSVVHARFIN